MIVMDVHEPLQENAAEVGVLNTGKVFSWGWSSSGQLGLGWTHDMSIPHTIPALDGQRVSNVSAGLSHSAVVTDSGDLYTFGKGKYGRLGDGDERDHIHVRRVKISANGLHEKRVIKVSCGGYHTACIAARGELYTWGRNHFGQLGLGHTNDANTPQLVPNIHAHDLALGSYHTLVATGPKELLSCGSNNYGELGFRGFQRKNSLTKVEIRNVEGMPIASIAAGTCYSAVVLGSQLYVWGINNKGQLGLGRDDATVAEPTLVEGLKNQIVTQVSCGVTHTAAVTESGWLYTWGNGSQGQLGYGTLNDLTLTADMRQNSPRRVKDALWKKAVLNVKCGSYHTVALCDTGELYAWGLGDYGQLGQGAVTNLNQPYLIRGPLTGKRITNFDCGGRHTIAATDFYPLIQIPKSTYKKEMKALLGEDTFGDVTLVVIDEEGQKEMMLHKVILARCSRLKLSKTDKILLHNLCGVVNSRVLRCLLEYLYTDNISKETIEKSGLDEHALAVDLRLLSEKLGMDMLYSNMDYKLNVGLDEVDLQVNIPKTLGSDLQGFVNSPEYSDIQFEVSGEQIYAHKAILAARSPHFHALFHGQFKESKERVIHLEEDVNPQAFKAMLEYIYTDNANLEDDVAVELLTLANEYSLDRLKAYCEDFVEKGIDSENVAWLYEISERYNAPQLKKFSLYYLLQHYEEASNTEGFKALSPDVIEDLKKYKRMRPNVVEKQGCSIQ